MRYFLTLSVYVNTYPVNQYGYNGQNHGQNYGQNFGHNYGQNQFPNLNSYQYGNSYPAQNGYRGYAATQDKSFQYQNNEYQRNQNPQYPDPWNRNPPYSNPWDRNPTYRCNPSDCYYKYNQDCFQIII